MTRAGGDTPGSGIARMRASVRGRVQGVGFRWYVREAALALALKGYVKNERDGSVLVVAEGSPDRLEELLAGLRRGPRSAAVDDVSVDWPEPGCEFTGFEVKF